MLDWHISQCRHIFLPVSNLSFMGISQLIGCDINSYLFNLYYEEKKKCIETSSNQCNWFWHINLVILHFCFCFFFNIHFFMLTRYTFSHSFSYIWLIDCRIEFNQKKIAYVLFNKNLHIDFWIPIKVNILCVQSSADMLLFNLFIYRRLANAWLNTILKHSFRPWYEIYGR